MNRGLALVAVLTVGYFVLPPAAAEPPPPNADEFFEKEVRPILVARCLECHGDTKPKGGLRLTTRANVLKGTDNGPAAVAGKPDDSPIIQAIRQKDVLKMPKDGKLPEREVAVLTRWVELGLPWPKSDDKIVAGPKFQITDEQRKFWSFQPVKVVAPPALKNKDWPRSDLDRYVLAGLEAKGLRPAKPADRRTLLRRATFDLTGLPPTPADMDAFVKDDAPDAFAKVIDRLLASKAYGERWGRHWLDLVRYTDSFDARGVGNEGDVADAWRYRDWVVDAFNRDLPYDKFLTDQIAGDLVPAKDGFNRDGVIATGFLAIGNWGGGDADKEKLLTDIVDDQVDVVSRTFLGLTVACARCHDHKFDPISTADYYALGGIFFSTHILPEVGPKTGGPPMLRIPLATPAELEQRKQYTVRLADAEKQLKQQADKHYRDFAQAGLKETAKYLVAAWEYQNSQSPGTLAEFARRKELHEFALRQWLDYLGAGDYVLMTKPITNGGGMPGVFGWRGEPDCPNALVNTTDKEVTLTTLKLPPKSVSVHPGPKNGVVVAWHSPFTGTVKVTGGVTDADPNCGDGIAWVLDHRTAASRGELASGEFANGGAQRFDRGKNAERLKAVEVKAGDRIELLVLPKENHACDTTVVDLVITSADGAKVWNLARDVVAAPPQNGKGDAPWSFLDMARSRRAGQGANAGPALAAWEKAVAEVASGKRDRKAIEEAAQEFQKAFTATDATSPFWITRREDETVLPADARDDLAKRAAELEELKKNPPAPLTYADGAQEGGVPNSPHAGLHDVRVHVRGRYDRLGDLVPRRFPEVLAGKDQKPMASGSGRLQLAGWLTRPEHPLTARVMVNRVWQYHFGEGIVRTPSNFGKLGERPTHPELLDYLAHEFVQSGWSVKHLHRLMMLSAAYQQASEAEPETRKADPDNRLFGRMQRRRLEAEAVRDNLLAVSGKLDAKMGGPAVRDFGAPRRTLYLMTIRSDRSGFGPLFDSADPTAPVDRRTISTVAPQALFLLNNPFVLEQTRALAQRITGAVKDDKDRIRHAYQLLYGRDPSAAEEQIGLEFLKRGTSSEKAWAEYCQVLLCANEFIYVD